MRSVNVGLGFIGFGEYGYADLTFMAGTRDNTRLLNPQVGLKVMQLVPFSSSSRSHAPSPGLMVGVATGERDLRIFPHLTVYVAPPNVNEDFRLGRVIVVPSITIMRERWRSVPGASLSRGKGRGAAPRR
jgi:hypothetical protein